MLIICLGMRLPPRPQSACAVPLMAPASPTAAAAPTAVRNIALRDSIPSLIAGQFLSVLNAASKAASGLSNNRLRM